MASVASPRSPLISQALTSPLEFLPVTRFPTMDERLDSLHELMVEKQKERDVILAQPYRTTSLISPCPKTRPDLVNNKLTGKHLKPTIYRPLDPKSVVANLDEDRALVNRQYNSPRPLYSDQNMQEAIYVQTGVNYPGQQQPVQAQQFTHRPQQQQQQQQQPQQYIQQHQQLSQQQIQKQHQQQYHQQFQQSQLQAPLLRTPDSLPEFNPQKSPTYRAILEEEGPGTLHSAPNTQAARAPIKQAHSTAPTYHLNSVGMPNDRIAQSGTFKRLMWNVMRDA